MASLTPVTRILDLPSDLLEEFQTDLSNLETGPMPSLEITIGYIGKKSIYKAAFKRGPHHDFYLRYRHQIRELRQQYLPFRAVDYIRRGLKAGQALYFFPDSLQRYVPQSIDTEQQKEVWSKLEAEFLEICKQNEVASNLASRITLFHGTNSTLLASLSSSSEPDYLLEPTGRLLNRGKAPMSGEISCGGTYKNGVNQTMISVGVVEQIARCWEYAKRISHSFVPPSDIASKFQCYLQNLKMLSPEDNHYDSILVSMLRLKQWAPEEFSKLCAVHADEIQQITQALYKKGSYNEMQIIRALEYPIEELQAAIDNVELREKINKDFFSKVCAWSGNEWWMLKDCARSMFFIFGDKGWITARELLQKHTWSETDLIMINSAIFFARLNWKSEISFIKSRNENPDFSCFLQKCESAGSIDNPDELLGQIVRPKVEAHIRQNRRPFETRYQRLLKVFGPPCTQFKPLERQMILKPFPLLLASTKLRPVFFGDEYVIPQAHIGDEIDLFFVPSQNMQETEQWLVGNQLDQSVKVLSTDLLKGMQMLPLVHSQLQTIDYRPSFDNPEQVALNQSLSQYAFPIYRQTYKNGAPRTHHGVPHAVRTAFFSLIWLELYRSQGKKITTRPADLVLAAALHDCAREDDGEDLWDAQSGIICAEILEKQGTPKIEAERLGYCVAKKDSPSDCVEQSVIHDADCTEIIRCLSKPEMFRCDELRAMKDLDPDTVYAIVAEAKKFIALTEQPLIKRFLETSEEPYRSLFQILSVAEEQFPTLYQLAKSGIHALAGPSHYILPVEIEETVMKWAAS